MYASFKPSQHREARDYKKDMHRSTGASLARRRSERQQQAMERQAAQSVQSVRGREVWSDDEGDFVQSGEGWNR